jgi:hypothetical protein
MDQVSRETVVCSMKKRAQLWLLVALAAGCGGQGGDAGKPIVRFTSPDQDQRVHETITVGVRAHGRAAGLARIDVFQGDQLIASSATDPLAIKWDTRSVAVGGYTELEAVATDSAGATSRAKVRFLIDRGTLVNDQKEAVYSLINDGDLALADNLLLGIWDLGERSEPVHIDPITWLENPFDKYWRFLFYGLRPLADLTWGYYAVNDARYRDKLLEILTSYVDYDEQRAEIPGWSFDDRHTSAFRAMALVNSYGKLTRSADLSPELASRLRAACLKVGAFLFRPENFEGTYNHGFTEASALLLIATYFPDAPDAAAWQATALDRLDSLMQVAVDGDGVEVEKSPFYHFYVMNFANEIARWARQWGVPVSENFTAKAAAMTRYATYIAHPNGDVPLIGASVDLDARRQSQSINQRLGASDPFFEYMRTGGRAGVAPTERNILFRESGHSVLRSGWGAAGAEYDGQTHIVFNVGPYRTTHSHYDGLSIVYASAGQALLTDSGLFVYEDGPEVAYFRSTRAHNTVVVDGADQAPGQEHAGATLTGPSWAYQSGSHQLYTGVLHRRGVLLLERDLAVVIDRLESSAEHDYAQTWHFDPDASVTADRAGAAAMDTAGQVLVVLRQALTDGVTTDTIRGASSPIQGWYSPTYGTMVENTVAEYHVRAAETTFVTLIASGPQADPPPSISATASGQQLILNVRRGGTGASIDIAVTALADVGESVQVSP